MKKKEFTFDEIVELDLKEQPLFVFQFDNSLQVWGTSHVDYKDLVNVDGVPKSRWREIHVKRAPTRMFQLVSPEKDFIEVEPVFNSKQLGVSMIKSWPKKLPPV